MVLSLFLPESFAYDPGDGLKLALRLELFNSVDGSTRFRALMGWFCFVCSKGLVISVTRSDLRRRHIGDIGLADVADVLLSGIQEAEKEKENFGKWRQKQVKAKDLSSWVEKELRKDWGFKAATRVFHISRAGHDVQIAGPYKKHTPLTIPVRKTVRVSGAPKRSENLYDVSQILAWLAKERRDVQEQLEWCERIPDLLEPLWN